MSPENPTMTDPKERIPFPELETNDLTNAIIFELTPNGKFSEEQLRKMKELGAERNGITIFYDFKHIIFSFPDEDRLFLCLDNEDNCYHRYMWKDLKYQFGQNLILRDAGEFCVYQDEPIIRKYVSIGLSRERHEITQEECFACRQELSNMNIGFTIR